MAAAGDTIYVADGTYAAAAGRTNVNRVAVDKAVTVQSVNGPTVTTIQGCQVAGTFVGDGAVRGAYLTNGATLTGFTLTGGATRNSGDYSDQSGGGVWCESGATVNRCIISGNVAAFFGAGACSASYWARGTLNNCLFTGNSTLNNGGGGGGAYNSTLNNCTLTGNSCLWSGRGDSYGGGAEFSTLNNCILVANSAFSGGAAEASILNNCDYYGNSPDDIASCDLYNCLNADPLFTSASNLRLQSAPRASTPAATPLPRPGLIWMEIRAPSAARWTWVRTRSLEPRRMPRPASLQSTLSSTLSGGEG